jgi:hydrogenase expression/formation protein HypC
MNCELYIKKEGVIYMCVAVPGKVIAIEGDLAQVDFNGNIVNANIALIDAKIGDYVLIHAGCAIEVLSEQSAEEIKSLFDELEELMK